MGAAADARVAADHTNVAGEPADDAGGAREPADHARQPAGDAREPDCKGYSLRMNALASSGKTLASVPARAEFCAHRTHASQTNCSHRLGLADKRVPNKPEARRQSFWCLSW